MTRERSSRFLVAAALALAALLAGATAATSGDTPPARKRLRALYGRYLAFGPHAIAMAEGYFEAEGLDVELVHLTTTSDAMPAVIRGEIDVGAGLIKVADFNAMARGATLRIVADQGHCVRENCVTAALVARPEFLRANDPESPDHLRRARVSATPLSYGEYVLETFALSRGLVLSDLTLLRLPAAAAVNALADGSLDFTYVAEPFITNATQSSRGVVWKSLQEIVPDAQLAAILFGPNLLTKDRDAGRRFLTAYLRGVRQYRQGKTPRNVEIISKETGLSPEVVRTACWTSIRENGAIDVASVLDFQRWAVRRGVLDAALPPAKFWDPSFAEDADRALALRAGSGGSKAR
jgi:NitT/TauT family transport system substrate-binding protein